MEASCYADLLHPRPLQRRFLESASMSDTVIQPRPVGHPLAGERMSGARMIMQVLADEGVTAIFGYSGGALLPPSRPRVLFQHPGPRPGGPPRPLLSPAHAPRGARMVAAGAP